MRTLRNRVSAPVFVEGKVASLCAGAISPSLTTAQFKCTWHVSSASSAVPWRPQMGDSDGTNFESRWSTRPWARERRPCASVRIEVRRSTRLARREGSASAADSSAPTRVRRAPSLARHEGSASAADSSAPTQVRRAPSLARREGSASAADSAAPTRVRPAPRLARREERARLSCATPDAPSHFRR